MGLPKKDSPTFLLSYMLLHTAADEVTIAVAIVDLGHVWEELILSNPSQWEGSLFTAIWV
jgi:hypothetical protein